MQWDVVNRLVEDAKARGARVVMGGDPDVSQPGNFYPKTLIAGGAKHSGYGLEFGVEGLKSVSVPQVISG
jgi:hypothetical protein